MDQTVEWISVESGRMPPESETVRRLKGTHCSDPVLVSLRSTYSGARRVTTDVTYSGRWLTYGRGEWQVTHWAEMPEPPEEG